MADLDRRRPGAGVAASGASQGPMSPPQSGNLGDILERVLDKGIVIVGDIQINLLDIELLTIHLRLIVASVDTARRMGIDWWETDPRLSKGARDEKRRLEDRVEELERRLEAASGSNDRALTKGYLEEDDTARDE
jgi:hypothetical protein